MKIARVTTPSGPQHCEVHGTQIRLLEGDVFSGGAVPGPLEAFGDRALLVPTTPSKLLVVVGAFPGNRTRAEARQRPPRFSAKLTSSLIASGQPVVRPPWVDGDLHMEPEIAVVIGRRLAAVSPAEAGAGIFGYIAFNDVTFLDAIITESDYFKAKSPETFGVAGTEVETSLTPADLANGLTLRCFVNDHLVHEGNTRDFTYDVLETVSTASQICTLIPGDIISLGTPPNPASAAIGDHVRVEVESVGSLETVIS